MSLSEDVRSSYGQLAAAQKSGAGVPFYMRVVNRRAGRLIAAVAARSGRTPDEMTALSALLGLAGLVVLVVAPPTFLTGLVVVLLLQAGFAFDSADGQLARLTGGGSSAGEWLDHVVDAARVLLLHLAVAVALVRHADVGEAWLLLPLGFAVVASVRFFAQILAEQLAASSPVPSPPAPTRRSSSWIQTPADAGVVNLVFLLWAWTPLFLAGYAALAVANGALLLATLRRKRRALLAAAP